MWEQLKRRSSYQALPTIESKKPIDIFRDLHHLIFQNIRIIHVVISLNTIYIYFFFAVVVNTLTAVIEQSSIISLITHAFTFQNESSRHNASLIQAQTIVTLSKLVTPQAVHQCLKFIYSGSFDVDYTNLKVSISSLSFIVLHLTKIYVHNQSDVSI